MKVMDHGFPLQHLREERRRLAEEMAKDNMPPLASKILELAAIQQAMQAISAVIKEIDSGNYG